MNQKGFAKITLLVILVIALATALIYFAYFRKPSEVAISPTPTPTATVNPTANWKTYTNTQYGFSFKYPSNVFAYDAVDYTNGQIPDIAGFGYTKPGQYELGDTPAEKMGSARILVWTDVLQDLKSWVQIHEPNIKRADTEVGGIAALVNYSRATTASEGNPMTFKTYYLKTGNEIIKITGFSVTNQYSDNWITTFDKIVATFKFTKSWQIYKDQKFQLLIPPQWHKDPDRPGILQPTYNSPYYLIFDVIDLLQNQSGDAQIITLFSNGKLLEAERAIVKSMCGETDACGEIVESKPISISGGIGIEFIVRYKGSNGIHRTILKNNVLYRFWTSENEYPKLDPSPIELFRKITNTFKAS